MRLNWPVVSVLFVDAFCWAALFRAATLALR